MAEFVRDPAELSSKGVQSDRFLALDIAKQTDHVVICQERRAPDPLHLLEELLSDEARSR